MTKKQCGRCFKIKADGKYINNFFCDYHKKPIKEIKKCAVKEYYKMPMCPNCNDGMIENATGKNYRNYQCNDCDVTVEVRKDKNGKVSKITDFKIQHCGDCRYIGRYCDSPYPRCFKLNKRLFDIGGGFLGSLLKLPECIKTNSFEKRQTQPLAD